QLTGAIAAQQATLAQRVGQLQASVAARDSIISALTGTRTRVIDLASYSSLTPAARMFWDQQTQQWTMYASHLKQPTAGKTYQLWLIASGHPAPISAGTFTPDPAGSAVVHAKYALEPGTLRRIAVTEEPAGGVAAPTGPVVFAGVGR
ncbi:MAG: anti-sigma factor domain-containing protein, partial [Gemmatimonadaceae bacterium]